MAKDYYQILSVSKDAGQEQIKAAYRKLAFQYQKIIVKMPPNIKEGYKIRLKGMGAVGKSGEEAGDLYLEVRILVPWLQKIKSLFKLKF